VALAVNSDNVPAETPKFVPTAEQTEIRTYVGYILLPLNQDPEGREEDIVERTFHFLLDFCCHASWLDGGCASCRCDRF
jgi:hypothetical protein